jgi:predicted O-methyltransferase YrrM
MLKSLYKFLSPRYQKLFLDYPVKMEPRYGHGKKAHPELAEIINQQRPKYRQLLAFAAQHQAAFLEIKTSDKQNDRSLPTWNNGFFPGLDIVMLYSLLGHYKPKTYLEVGSGNSTKVAALAKRNFQLNTRLISIDPQPRVEMDQLADEIIRQPLENVDFSRIYALGENDMLFIDNSHRILPNSDGMVFFLEILPRLKKGVIVHVHDVYLPYDYPQFMCDRAYTEQYGLAIYLLANPEKFKVIMPNYFVSEDADLAAILRPLWQQPSLAGVEQHGGSFWFQLN